MTLFNEVTKLSKAMSDDNRVRIVTLIQREKYLCVCEISDTLNLSQPLVSKHLKQLKTAHILSSKKDRKWVIYNITTNPSELMKTYLLVLKQKEHMLCPLISCNKR